jgi:hypothetical protein
MEAMLSPPTRRSPSEDACVFGPLDEADDGFIVLIEQLQETRGDGHPDRHAEAPGAGVELLEQLVGQPIAGDARAARPVPPGAGHAA